jgi:myo-inositol 2-dehydrogenase/D-chiro-inositol 1-dehydrogenase
MAVKVAFLGIGGIMETHLRNLSGMKDVRMVAYCDTDIERAKRAAKHYGGRSYTDFCKMYDKEKPGAVFVAVPPFAHGGPEIEAAKRGIHLFVEKPIALTRDTGREIARAVRSAGIITSVGYNWRYLNHVAEARNALKTATVSLVMGYWLGGMPGVWWWRRRNKSGGQIVEQTTHIFDLVRYLVGDVETVYAEAATGAMEDVSGYNIDDSSVVTLRFKNGAVGHINSTCVLNLGYTVGVNVVARDLVVECQHNAARVMTRGQTVEYKPNVDQYVAEARAFIDSVKTGKRKGIKSTYADALKTQLVMMAAVKSIKTGEPVVVK